MENLKNLTLDEIIENIILGKYPYYSDEYGQAVNRVYCLNNLTNPIETAQKMADSQNFTVLCALAFIISETHSNDLLLWHNELRPIIRQVLSQKCYRAHFDLIDTLGFFIQNNIAEKADYLAYLDLIQSDNYIIQFQAISGLRDWCDDNWQTLALYSDLDFASISRLPENIQAEWFEKITKNQPFVYSLIVLTAIYRQYHDKDWIIGLCDTKNPYLFDFLNIYLFQAA